MTLPWPPHYYPEDVAKHATQNGVVAVHVDDLKRWQKQLHDAFDLGVKSAGGSIVPDRSNFVELALDRGQIDALADLADDVVDPKSKWYSPDYAPGLRRFLDNISIYRSRK